MTKEELLKNGSLIKESYSKHFKYVQFNPLFQRELTYQIFFDDYQSEAFELTDEIVDTLNFILSFDESDLNWMKSLCFKHFEECAANTSYGGRTIAVSEKHNNDCLAANKEVFGIYNEDQAFNAATLTYVTIQENIEGDKINTQFSLDFEVPWEEEHGMRFLFHNKVFEEVE